MSASPVGRLVVGVVSSVLPLALVGTGLTWLVEPTFTASYAAHGTARDADTDVCVTASLTANVTGASSRSRHRLLGWHAARVSAPTVAVAVSECATGRPYAGLDTLRVDQVWAESGCSLAAEQGDTFTASAEETDDQDADDAEGWQRIDGDAPCGEPAAQGTFTGDGPTLALAEPDLVLRFAGHTWSRTLCWTPRLEVRLVGDGGETAVLPIALPNACVAVPAAGAR